MSYCTTADMMDRFGPDEIQKATRVYEDTAAENNAKLIEAVEQGNGAVYGYLYACLGEALASNPPADLLPALKYHAVNFAREALDALTEEVRHLADKSREYFERLCDAYNEREKTKCACNNASASGSGRIRFGVGRGATSAKTAQHFSCAIAQAQRPWYAGLVLDETWRFG